VLEDLSIRRWGPGDEEAAYAIYGDPEVVRYLGSGGPAPSREFMAERVAAWGGQDRLLAVCRGGVPIGSGIFGVIHHSQGFEDLEEEHEVGWHLGREHWGQGIGTWIAQQMLLKAMESVPRVVAIAFPENLASLRIMEKIGMNPAGLTDRFCDLPGLALYEKNF
jgi:RimJ/RimL family protein N-acetyltransferase